MIKRVCVFCGSSPGIRAEYVNAARELGRVLVNRNLGLVFGGGRVGMMGELANVVIAGGGEVIGVIPRRLVDREIAHTGVSELRVVSSMGERKALMAELSDAFVALPGGIGTVDELFEALTWDQLGIHTKPCGILNVCQYFRDLLNFLDHAVSQQFLAERHRSMILVEESPEVLIDKLLSYDRPME